MGNCARSSYELALDVQKITYEVDPASCASRRRRTAAYPNQMPAHSPDARWRSLPRSLAFYLRRSFLSSGVCALLDLVSSRTRSTARSRCLPSTSEPHRQRTARQWHRIRQREPGNCGRRWTQPYGGQQAARAGSERSSPSGRHRGAQRADLRAVAAYGCSVSDKDLYDRYVNAQQRTTASLTLCGCH